jgi:Thymidylate synthase
LTPLRLVLPDFFESLIWELSVDLADAPDVNVGEWQAMRDPELPMLKTIEVEDVSFQYAIPETVEELQASIRPNLPWAEEHFSERVSGIPYNPPPSHIRWPFAQRGNTEHTDAQQKFSHTYPERMWPPRYLSGIRYPYGNLNDLVNLLKERPNTRQAYLPIWFPEDLKMANDSQRVPCTLGYHFLIRGDRMKITYYIRSCDFYRHFRDDVYMAARLCQWVADKVGVKPRSLIMHISSLHIFAAERSRVAAEVDTAVLLGKTE